MLGTINISTEYVFHAAFYLALKESDGQNKETIVTVDEIAKETGIPLPFLAKIMIHLTREKIVRSHRGRKGGYSLARDAQSISLLDIVHAVNHGRGCNNCFKRGELCPNASPCPFFPMWQEIANGIESILKKYSLHSLAVSIRNTPQEPEFLKGLRKQFSNGKE